jgi:hypothetical protein
MPYYLVQRFAAKGEQQPQYIKETFASEAAAVIRACSHYAVGFRGDFVIEDEDGNVITEDEDIRRRCTAARIG